MTTQQIKLRYFQEHRFQRALFAGQGLSDAGTRGCQFVVRQVGDAADGAEYIQVWMAVSSWHNLAVLYAILYGEAVGHGSLAFNFSELSYSCDKEPHVAEVHLFFTLL